MTTQNNTFGEAIVRILKDEKASMLDSNNILWKLVDGEWMGKRSVWTKSNSACWIEDTATENIKSWWCGNDSDYTEIFKRDK